MAINKLSVKSSPVVLRRSDFPEGADGEKIFSAVDRIVKRNERDRREVISKINEMITILNVLSP